MTQQKELFYGRKEELNFLNKLYKEKKSQLFVLYGRRRVGKTELVREFTKDKDSIYFLCEKTSIRRNIIKLSSYFYENTNNLLFNKLQFEDFEDLFKLFLEIKRDKKKKVIILDEFPFLIELNSGTTSIFQRIWDELLKDRDDIFLILLGSSVSMMEEEVLSHRSPLYGRRTAQWKLNEFKLNELKYFLPNYSFEDLIKLYSFVGGVPFYLQKINNSLEFYENIYDIFLYKGGFLYEEAENLLKLEFRESKNYKLILRAISEGKTKSGEIINYSGLDKTAISRYMEILENLNLVGYEFPLLRVNKLKNRHYFIKDNYFNFWFKYIFPNKSKIEEGRGKMILDLIQKDDKFYISKIFEDICKELILINFNYSDVGRQWGKYTTRENGKALTKTYEIDICAINEDKKEILFSEVKWQDNVDANKILEELKEKSKSVKWNNGEREEEFVIFARSFRNKNIKGCKLYDLKDIEKLFK